MLYFQTILVYTFLTLMMCYGAYLSKGTSRLSKVWGWLPIILFTLVFGFRYGVGIDFNNYADIYEQTENYTSLSELIENERYEVGFSLLLYMCHYVGAPVWSLFVIVAFIQIFLLYKTFNKEGNILIYIYATLILTGFCMFSFMNILRHEIAFCIFLYSLQYIRDNKLFKYWICCVLALSFHQSAIILFPLYFIWIRRKGVFNMPLIEAIAVIICFITSFISQWQEILHLFDVLIILLGYENYLESASEMTVNSVVGITRLLNLVVNLLIVVNSKKIKNHFQSDLFNILYDLFVIGTCLSYVFMGSMMLQRVIVYFYHTQFIVLAYALCYLYETRKQNFIQLFQYGVVSLFIFVSYSSFIYHCKDNTGAYVSYFQTDLHQTKDDLRDTMFDK